MTESSYFSVAFASIISTSCRPAELNFELSKNRDLREVSVCYNSADFPQPPKASQCAEETNSPMSTELTQVEDYYDADTFKRIKAFADTKETPFVVIDTATVAHQYDELQQLFPYASVYYAVKANPAPEIISMLRDKGSNFDVASIYELDKLLSLGVSADRCSYGNTIKKSKDIRYFYEKGVRMYATDSEADVRNIAKAAPGSKVYVRILTEGSGTADWPLSRKFGCQSDMAMDILVLARDLGLEPYGVSFHVGSQQRDIGAWDAAIGKVKVIFERLKEEDNITLKMLNLGGGFPANYLNRANSLDTYAEEITRFIEEDFGADFPEISLE